MIVDKLIEFLETSEPIPYSKIYADVLRSESETITLRQLTVPLVETKYMSGKYKANFNFSMICKSKDLEKAISQLNKFIEILTIDKQTDLNGFKILSCSPISTPSLTALSEQSDSIYECSFNVSYTSN